MANPDDWQNFKANTKEDKNFKEDAVPGEVLVITGKGPLVQTGKGMLILTDFAIDGEKTDSLGALVEGGMPVVLG